MIPAIIDWNSRRSAQSAEPAPLTTLDPYLFLGWSLTRLRVATIVILFLVTLTLPVRGRLGFVLESDILLYAVFTLTIEFVRHRLSAVQSVVWVPVLDLPVAASVYALGAAPGGLLFIPLFLNVISAAACMPLRGSLLYTAVVAGILVVIDPTFPLWSPEAGDVRRLASRLLIVAITAVGTAILTQRLRLEQTLAQKSQDESVRRAEIERLRADFIAGISHDLRTPLTGARAGIGMIEASAYDRLRPDELELIGSTRRNIQRLGRLIDDLITFNQLEASALQLTCVPLDLRAVIIEEMSTMHSLLHAKQQTLEVDLPEELPIAGDRQRLEQVVVNLVGNANQHTPRGTRIVIAGHTTAHEVRLTVSDTGPGIPDAEREAVYERFYRLGTSRGNSGLGLAIVKGIVELHGGRTWADSNGGMGAVFHVALPCYREEEPDDLKGAHRRG